MSSPPEHCRFDRQHVVPESVPVRIDALKRNNRKAVAGREGGVDLFGIVGGSATQCTTNELIKKDSTDSRI